MAQIEDLANHHNDELFPANRFNRSIPPLIQITRPHFSILHCETEQIVDILLLQRANYGEGVKFEIETLLTLDVEDAAACE